LHKNFMRLILAPVALVAGGSFLASIASATVVGTLGTGTAGTVTVNLTSAFFNTDPDAVGGGNSDVTSGTTLGFAGCPFTGSPTAGSAGCLPVSGGITINNADLTSITPSVTNANNFLTFAADPNLVFSINYPPGPGAANTNCALANAPGMSCSVFPGSPIVLTFLSSQESVVSLPVTGFASDTGVAGLATGSAYTGGFTEFLTQNLPNGTAPTPLDIQNYFCSGAPSVAGGGNTCVAGDFSSLNSVTAPDVGGSFTATAPASVPEPSTWALMLIGGALIGVTRVPRRRRS
jgi:hypothetical protein